jgi:dTDP-4-amino-4,6-dideoxygalactose transaminase
MSDSRKPSPIPQVSPKAAYLAQQAEIDAALARATRSGWYILGPEVESFEREFATYLGVNHTVGVANGTDAIELALRACEVERGDLVFTVSHTAVATVSAIEHIGAIPILVDIDPRTFTMDPACLEAALREVGRNSALNASRRRAVVPVHLYGQPADLPAILEIARRAGLQVVEDCAQAHGASLHGRKLGTWGDIAAFSFYPTKNLGALGDGGAIACNDEKLNRRLRALRQYGWEERYISSISGWNSRLDELQAAVLRVKLHALDQNNALRNRWARMYDELLGGAVQRPAVTEGAYHAYHQYVVRSAERDALKEHLALHDIGTGVHYPVPVHLQPAYRGKLPMVGSLAHTEQAAREILSLPMYPELSADEVSFVAQSVAEWSASSAPA